MFEKFTFAIVKEWIMDRLKERSSWDGTVIVAISIAILLSVPFVEIFAWGALAYGIWTIIKKELKIDVDI
jgi:hypothetical protein